MGAAEKRENRADPGVNRGRCRELLIQQLWTIWNIVQNGSQEENAAKQRYLPSAFSHSVQNRSWCGPTTLVLTRDAWRRL
jgi:hypothetical protein